MRGVLFGGGGGPDSHERLATHFGRREAPLGAAAGHAQRLELPGDFPRQVRVASDLLHAGGSHARRLRAVQHHRVVASRGHAPLRRGGLVDPSRRGDADGHAVVPGPPGRAGGGGGGDGRTTPGFRTKGRRGNGDQRQEREGGDRQAGRRRQGAYSLSSVLSMTAFAKLLGGSRPSSASSSSGVMRCATACLPGPSTYRGWVLCAQWFLTRAGLQPQPGQARKHCGRLVDQGTPRGPARASATYVVASASGRMVAGPPTFVK